jgi:phosphohistidine phosphatase
MKLLTVLRHAKAENPAGYTTDVERPLTARGRKDAMLSAGAIATLSPKVDWILSSPSVRTRQSTDEVAKVLAYTGTIVWNEAVYDATPETLLEALQLVPPDAEHVLLVGHNPGMEGLVSGLCSGAPERMTVVMATGAVAFVHVEIVRWNQLRWGCGALYGLVKPKLLRR